MPPIDIADLIAQLTGATTTQPLFSPNPLLTTDALYAASKGVSPSNVSSAVNPAAFLTGGIFDPARFQAMRDEVLRQQQADYMAQMKDYLGGAANPDSVFSYNYKPFYQANPAIADILINGVFEDLKQGVLPEQAKLDVASAAEATGLDITPEIQQFIDSEIDTFAKELPKYYETLAKAPNAEQLAMIEQLRPTAETANYQLMSDLGVPELAFLPSPADQYQFTAEQMNPQGISAAEAAINPAALRATGATAEMPMAGKLAVMANREFGRPDEYAVRTAAEPIARKAKEDYLKANLGSSNVADFLQESLVGTKGPSAFIGGKILGKTTAQRNEDIRKQAEQIYLETLRREAGARRRAFSTPARITAEQINPALARALAGVRSARQGVETQRQLGTQQAEALTQLLTNAGVTPFQQAIKSSNLLNLLLAGK